MDGVGASSSVRIVHSCVPCSCRPQACSGKDPNCSRTPLKNNRTRSFLDGSLNPCLRNHLCRSMYTSDCTCVISLQRQFQQLCKGSMMTMSDYITSIRCSVTLTQVRERMPQLPSTSDSCHVERLGTCHVLLIQQRGLMHTYDIRHPSGSLKTKRQEIQHNLAMLFKHSTSSI